MRLIAKKEPEDPSVGSTTYWSGNSQSRILLYSFCAGSAFSIIVFVVGYYQPNRIEFNHRDLIKIFISFFALKKDMKLQQIYEMERKKRFTSLKSEVEEIPSNLGAKSNQNITRYLKRNGSNEDEKFEDRLCSVLFETNI